MTAYYNEIDPFCVDWLRNLIDAGMIPHGDVDDRPIQEVRADDLAEYDQCHFFAGLGGWPYACRLAGLQDEDEVWTGSCPCQPFSNAGKRKGFADERHLWPFWFDLIRECRPPVVFGEQVASAKLWLDGVYTDLEGEGFAVGAADLPACSVDAPHKRDRTWFVAYALGVQLRAQPRWRDGTRRPEASVVTDGSGLGDALGAGLEVGPGERCDDAAERAPAERGGSVGDASSDRKPSRWSGGLAAPDREADLGRAATQYGRAGLWSDTGWLHCAFDGKARRVEPGICLLAHGVPDRVAKLRALGNAIVPQVAAKFIRAALGVDGS